MSKTPLLESNTNSPLTAARTQQNQHQHQNNPRPSIFSCCFPPNRPDNIEHSGPIFKRRIAIVGSIACGKSSLATVFVRHAFSDAYAPTISDILNTEINYNNRLIQLSIKDSPGRDQYDSFTAEDCIDIHGFIIVFALNDNKSFHVAQILNEKILKAKGYDVPRILVGTKCDLSRVVSKEVPKAVATDWGIPYFETSSKDNVNIIPAFYSIVQEIEDSLTPRNPGPCNLL